ncbi:hypothetical protein HDU97_004705 [Phlyctochytrium planicorne]|nr:hypothetical protein HDU97_004705 [Phlyctochytrium planicorne]
MEPPPAPQLEESIPPMQEVQDASPTTASTSLTSRPEVTDSAASHIQAVLTHIPISVLLVHRRGRFEAPAETHEAEKSYPQKADRAALADGCVAVREDMPLGQVLGVMSKYGIVATPVYKDGVEIDIKEGEGEEGGRMVGRAYTGIATIYDILGYTVFQHVFDKIELEQTNHIFQRWLDIDKDTKNFFQTPISDILGMTLESTLLTSWSAGWTLRSTDSIDKLVRMLVVHHRVLVVDDPMEGDLVAEAEEAMKGDAGREVMPGRNITMVTQTDLLRYLIDFRDAVASIPSSILLSSKLLEIAHHRKQVFENAPPSIRDLKDRDISQPSQLPILPPKATAIEKPEEHLLESVDIPLETAKETTAQAPQIPRASVQSATEKEADPLLESTDTPLARAEPASGSTQRTFTPKQTQPTPATPQRPLPKHIITVPKTYTALQSFRIMHLHRITGVPITDESHKTVIANLSASDLRGITETTESLASLLLPVLDFLRRTREGMGKSPTPPVPAMLTYEDTLWTAISTAIESGIHKIWVKGSDAPAGSRPVDVLTLTDMIAFYLPRDGLKSV